MGKVKESMLEFCYYLCKGTSDDPIDLFNQWIETNDASITLMWEQWVQ